MNVVKLNENAVVPTRKHDTDAGLDLYSCYDTCEVEPGEHIILSTGIAVELPRGCVGQIWPKSRSDFLIGGGIVDQSYRGEILVKVFNVSGVGLWFHRGDAIAQLVIVPVLTPEVVEVKDFDKETERGETGGIVTQYQQATLVSNITGVE